MIGSMVSLVRRNHALEHATLQILAAKKPGTRVAGASNPRGFWVFGQLDIEELRDAVEEAQRRLRAGESKLAIHPQCGTNFAVSGLAAGTAAWLLMLGDGSLRRKMDRLPLLVTMVTLIFIVTYPLGPRIQESVTTDANLGRLRVVAINHFERGGMPVHQVLTRELAE